MLEGNRSILKFQLRWHNYYSALLLAGSCQLSAIKLEELPSYPVSVVRKCWLDFCEVHSVPVPESNLVMMRVSSAIYQFLLQYVEDFQSDLHNTAESSSSLVPASQPAVDGDDVYYHFGGAAICDMFHLQKRILCGKCKRITMIYKIQRSKMTSSAQ